MDTDLSAIVNSYERELGVQRELIIRAIESALEVVYGKYFRAPGHITVTIDRKKLTIKAMRSYTVSDNLVGSGYLPLEVARKSCPTAVSGTKIEVEVAQMPDRRAIQNALQIIFSKLSEAKRENVIINYGGRIGEIISGTVTKVTGRGDVHLSIDKGEAIIQRRDCLPNDNFTEGDQVRAIIVKVLPLEEVIRKKMPSVILSRTSNAFFKQLFVTEVSEINDGTVEIVAISREPGSHSKISVRSYDPNIDPVGACVGVHGVRVRTISGELGNEKIDIIKWSDDILKYVQQALSPAKISSITQDPKDPRKVSVIVPDDQLSLAIGRNGQNVKLASKLVNGTISVTKKRSENSFESMFAKAVNGLVAAGIDSKDARLLTKNGFTSLDGIAEESAEALAEATGLSESVANEIVALAIKATQNP